VVFIDSRSGAIVATLALYPEALVAAPQGLVAYADDPSWREHAWCLVGHRAGPFAWCEDGIRDDALVQRLLLPRP